MPSNAGNVGVDYSFGYFDADTNSLVPLGDIQNVSITAMKHDLKNSPYNKPPKFGFAYDGYRISFNITRTGPELEQLAMTREANFNAGRVEKPGYLNKTISEVNGFSRIQYTGFVFFLTDHGDISREKLVTLKGEGFASTKVNL